MSQPESWASSPLARRVMQGNRSRDTVPEMAVRRLLHAAGLRYRVSIRPEPGLRRTADIVFTKKKIAIFIDGCYWHGCPEHCHLTSSNYDYWLQKIEGNKRRDAQTNAHLRAAGWTVLRYWEHTPAEDVVDEIIGTLEQ
ncbi:very short patch repair endonuclease [Kocuria sp. KD4]|uniref:very short patch repair endonuclease n=1 Tax=Kocuria sp. KD4 TaxID=2719588 RepID=UPI00142798E9|nr:very short patch repair endonuclease [Kocuria sp. KD4]QIR70707.1 very short patch repair endonuclease [Kocuria sp. KD4]